MSSLEISHLKVSLGQKLILNDLSFSLAEGQIAALLGPSGCGKTTLLRSIAGLIQPSDGTIRFGKQLVSLSSLVMPSHKRKIGYVPQEGALFPHLSVADNIAFGLDRSVFTKDQIRQTTKEMLNLIGLQGFENRMPNQLSGGQQTRVALARALAIKPAIVLLDEPFSALDAALRGDLRADVIDLLRKSNTTAILVTHDREEALVSADVVGFAKEMEQMGAGELLIQSVNKDGTYQGLEVAVLQEVSQSVGIPVVGLGGLASLEEIRTLHPSTNLNGYAAGSLFIYQGKHRGVLVNYPSSEEVKKLFS